MRGWRDAWGPCAAMEIGGSGRASLDNPPFAKSAKDGPPEFVPGFVPGLVSRFAARRRVAMSGVALDPRTAPAFPMAAKVALGDVQLRKNVRHATDVIQAKRAR